MLWKDLNNALIIALMVKRNLQHSQHYFFKLNMKGGAVSRQLKRCLQPQLQLPLIEG